jgi:hypothetical protein
MMCDGNRLPREPHAIGFAHGERMRRAAQEGQAARDCGGWHAGHTTLGGILKFRPIKLFYCGLNRGLKVEAACGLAFRQEGAKPVPPPTNDDPYEGEAYRLWAIKQRSK